MSEKNDSSGIGQKKPTLLMRHFSKEEKLGTVWHVVMVVIFIELIVLGIIIYHYSSQKKAVVYDDDNGKVCSGVILKTAGEELAPANTEQLKKTVKQIMSFSDYEQDSNCLYIVDSYYINIGDYSNASKYLKLLEARYTTSFVLSSEIDGHYNSLKPLIIKVSNMSVLNNQIDKNAQIFAGKK